jgi:choline dehydrogenase-like flavoprotein
MKKQITRALLGLTAALALTVAANARVMHAVVLNVPFNFVAGEKQMPAGRYTVQRVNFDSESALLIRSEDSRSTAIVLTTTGETQPLGAALTFRQHGDRYFLAEISMLGTASVRKLPKTSAERRLERELAEQKPGGSKTVTVVGSVQ